MPRRDGTGPMGMGPMTGRGAGYCIGVISSRCERPASFRANYKRGCGFGGMWSNTNSIQKCGNFKYVGDFRESESNEDQKEYLSRQIELLENQLQQLKNQLSR